LGENSPNPATLDEARKLYLKMPLGKYQVGNTSFRKKTTFSQPFQFSLKGLKTL
jgi:hypothetical protein